ncbi:alpha-hydroxy acid oxidase [Streptomyces albipurpureus]|uniref:Alpha-hydroxy-acid oxidizing protein n=1 Tax=Streptomyces albipurpureus TaxID=2897419 RepID=A0ABT0UYZ1_9ACTN|nr:alpha-hydroxy acid oxidase [Streptomyces sp. CWNU-1]MCM2393778.1 alpha-hydroxy-acid oxidizing protein [Streptomyces sp. CWNU-1]
MSQQAETASASKPDVVPADGAPPVSLDDLANRARSQLSQEAWDWLEGGAERELTLAANRTSFDRVALLPRILVDVSSCTTATRLVRSAAALPLAVAPVAYQRLFHPEGELAVARATATAGVPFTISTLSSVSMEEIAATGTTTWFQLYWLKDRSAVIDLVQRAEKIGCEALVLTVDVPLMGRRLRDVRHGFSLPDSVRAVNLEGGAKSGAHQQTRHGSAVAAHTAATFSSSITWRDVEWLRERTHLPLIIKGVLDPADAVLAARSGAAAVVVSNHGGRQLDQAAPTAAVLPSVVSALEGVDDSNCDVLVDSGIRSGSDVLSALALGAQGVLLGRPAMWGLAAAGEQGCDQVLSLLAEQLRHAMTLAGCPDLEAARHLSTLPMPCERRREHDERF